MKIVNDKIIQNELLIDEWKNEKNEGTLYSYSYIIKNNNCGRNNKLLTGFANVSLHLRRLLWVVITS